MMYTIYLTRRHKTIYFVVFFFPGKKKENINLQRPYIENENIILQQLLFQEENIERTKEYLHQIWKIEKEKKERGLTKYKIETRK